MICHLLRAVFMSDPKPKWQFQSCWVQAAWCFSDLRQILVAKLLPRIIMRTRHNSSARAATPCINTRRCLGDMGLVPSYILLPSFCSELRQRTYHLFSAAPATKWRSCGLPRSWKWVLSRGNQMLQNGTYNHLAWVFFVRKHHDDHRKHWLFLLVFSFSTAMRSICRALISRIVQPSALLTSITYCISLHISSITYCIVPRSSYIVVRYCMFCFGTTV